jgi:hypothetical protein
VSLLSRTRVSEESNILYGWTPVFKTNFEKGSFVSNVMNSAVEVLVLQIVLSNEAA